MYQSCRPYFGWGSPPPTLVEAVTCGTITQVKTTMERMNPYVFTPRSDRCNQVNDVFCHAFVEALTQRKLALAELLFELKFPHPSANVSLRLAMLDNAKR